MFDENGRIVVFNQRYLEMYGLSPEVVKPGCSLTELISHRKDVGLFDGDVKRYCADIIAAIRFGKTSSQMHDSDRWPYDSCRAAADRRWWLGCDPRRCHGAQAR